MWLHQKFDLDYVSRSVEDTTPMSFTMKTCITFLSADGCDEKLFGGEKPKLLTCAYCFCFRSPKYPVTTTVTRECCWIGRRRRSILGRSCNQAMAGWARYNAWSYFQGSHECTPYFRDMQIQPVPKECVIILNTGDVCLCHLPELAWITCDPSKSYEI